MKLKPKKHSQPAPDDRALEDLNDETFEQIIPEEDLELGIQDGKDDTVFMKQDEPELHPEEAEEGEVFPNEEIDDAVLPSDIGMPEHEIEE